MTAACHAIDTITQPSKHKLNTVLYLHLPTSSFNELLSSSGFMTSCGEGNMTAAYQAKKKNMCVSGYPIYPNFSQRLAIQKNEILSYATYPICGHFLLVLPLLLSYLKLYCCLNTWFD